MEKNKTTSVSKKVLKVITVVTLSMYAFMLVVIGTVAKNSIYSLEEDYMSEVSRNVSTNIERTMNEYLSIVKILSESSTIKQVLASADGGLNTMQGHYRAEEIVHDFTAIKKDYPDSILTVAILDVEQDGYFLDNGAYSDSSFSFKERPYYSVVTTGQMLVTDPYLDTLTGDMVISIVAPVFSDNGTVLGAVLVDVVIDFVQQLVSASDFDSTGTSVILDINKNIIASTTGTLGNNYSSISMTGDLLSSQLSNPTGVLFEMSMQGLDRVGVVNKIGDLGWVTVTSLGDQQYKEHSNEVLRVLLAQLIIAYVLTMVIISKTINKRLKPLEGVSEAMEHLTKGDLHYKFDFESDDEIGELAEDFRKTSVELSIYIDEITKQLRSFGDGDFTYESDVEFIGDFGNIQIALAQFKSLMSKTLGNLTTTIEEVSLGAMQVAHGSQSLAQGAEEQTGEIDNLAQTVDLITKTVKDNAENANEANNLGSSVTVILKESTDYMVELSEAISQIQTSSTDIEKIIKTIDDIAFQTNILALNAAVEASRAGEAGKGFAVVADEVRNLAQKSTEAANGTTSLIQNSLDAVQKGVKIAQETNQSFAKVDESSKKVLDLISKISIASTEQANSINEISVGLNQISTVVQQNSAISEENAAVAEELSSQSTVMTNSVQAFKISKNDNQF